MSYTGHKELLINKQNIVDHLRPVMKNEAQFYGVEMPNDKQIALVVSALRMHHTVTHAAGYDFSELGHPDEVTKYWPIESSVGRYFRDASADILRRE